MDIGRVSLLWAVLFPRLGPGLYKNKEDGQSYLASFDGVYQVTCFKLLPRLPYYVDYEFSWKGSLSSFFPKLLLSEYLITANETAHFNQHLISYSQKGGKRCCDDHRCMGTVKWTCVTSLSGTPTPASSLSSRPQVHALDHWMKVRKPPWVKPGTTVKQTTACWEQMETPSFLEAHLFVPSWNGADAFVSFMCCFFFFLHIDGTKLC